APRPNEARALACLPLLAGLAFRCVLLPGRRTTARDDAATDWAQGGRGHTAAQEAARSLLRGARPPARRTPRPGGRYRRRRGGAARDLGRVGREQAGPT